jgi:hypothetical protein
MTGRQGVAANRVNVVANQLKASKSSLRLVEVIGIGASGASAIPAF